MELNKNYILFTPSISNMGGAQLYALRRVSYLISKGYNVKLIVSSHNTENFILEREFAEIPVLHINQLQYPISFYSKTKIDRILGTIKDFLKEFINGVIETHSLHGSVWGELIASKLQFKHIIYLLSEQTAAGYLYFPGLNFFEYKLKKGELYGTSDCSLSLIFERQIDNTDNNYINVPFNPLELTELSEPRLSTLGIDRNSFIIGTLARIEKPYIETFIQECIHFAEKHQSTKITLIIAGGGENSSILKRLNETYNNSTVNKYNLSIIFTGYIKKLGKDFFEMLNVFVGQGTASINAISQGCATLNIDPDTNQSSGIFGIDIDNFAYPKNGITYSIAEKLDSLILNEQLLEYAKLKGVELFHKQYSVTNCFDKMDKLIETSDAVGDYYPLRISLDNRIKDRYNSILLNMKIKVKVIMANFFKVQQRTLKP